MSQLTKTERARILEIHKDKAEAAKELLESRGWATLSKWIRERIVALQKAAFAKGYDPAKHELQMREVYTLKRVLSQPEVFISLAKESEEGNVIQSVEDK